MICAVAALTLATVFVACSKDKDEPDKGSEISFSHDGHQYLIIKEKKSWADAAAYAVERDGYLVEINSAAEQTAVYAAITKNVSASYTTVDDGGGVAYVWIGGTDQATEGSWLWNGENKSGTNLTKFWQGKNNGTGTGYNNWGAGEPDDFNNSQDYAAIGLAAWPQGNGSLGSAGQWNDINGNNKLFFVVEIEGD